VNKEGEAREAPAQYLVQTLRSYGHRGCSGSSRKGGVEALPPSKGACSILPTVRLLRAGGQLPGPRHLGPSGPGAC
jgi:hypothetical protein